ncbi:MAG: hypothetical protein ACOCWW_01285 [Bacteroidota bacterium]
MMKKILGLFVVAALFFSCSTQEKKEEKEEKNIKVISADKIMADIQKYVDQEVIVKGMVNHVCSHGGKRMFIIGENPDEGIRITPNEKIGIFEKELEGNTVIIKGVLKKLIIDDKYIAQLEKEITEGVDNEAFHDHSSGDHDEEETEVDSSKIKQVEKMKSDIAESEEGFVAQYWIEASEVEVKEYEETEKAESEVKTEDHDHDHEQDHEEHSNE